MNLRPAVLTGVAALLLVTAAVCIYFWMPPRQTASVPVPSRDASPEEVVEAYVRALDAHDCDTAYALVDGDTDGAEAWCRRVASLDGLEVSAAEDEEPAWSGRDADEQVVRVVVEFDLTYRPLRSDGSMDQGRTTWGYLLVRGSQDDPWRIFSQGNG